VTAGFFFTNQINDEGRRDKSNERSFGWATNDQEKKATLAKLPFGC
jgi:hypothetical protein